MTTKTKTTGIDRRISQLRLSADFLALHRDLLSSLDYDAMSAKMPDADYEDTPWVGVEIYSPNQVAITCHGPNQREHMAMLRRAIGGKWEKDGYYETFEISRRWGRDLEKYGEYITIKVNGSREEICQRVVVGTETVTHPAIEAEPERTETVEKVEWVCGNLLD